MQIKVNGVTISVENSPVTTGNLAKQESLASIIASQESAMVDIIRSEEAMDTTIKVIKNFSDKQLLKGQESFGETMANVGNAIIGFLEKIFHIISQFIGKKVAQLNLNALGKRIEKMKVDGFKATNINWAIAKSSVDSLYDMMASDGKAPKDNGKAGLYYQMKNLTDGIKFNKSAQNGLKEVYNGLDAAATNIQASIQGGTPFEADGVAMYKFDFNHVQKVYNDAKSNYQTLIANMTKTQKLLDANIKTLKAKGKADAGDARAIGKFCNNYFKIVFAYYKVVGGLKPFGDNDATRGKIGDKAAADKAAADKAAAKTNK